MDDRSQRPDRREKRTRHWLMVSLAAVLGLLLLAAIGLGIKNLLGERPTKTHKPSSVTLLPDKPPPPPPPPKEEKRPEPPKEERKEMKVAQAPEPVPQPAQNEPLKMEGAAGDGGGPFGAGTVGREYSGGSIGAIGGGAGSFSGRLQRHFQDQLNRIRKLRESDYRVSVKIWLRHDGSVEKAELAGTTGNETLDALLRESLQQIPPLRETLPERLAQPLKIRVTNRGTV